MVHLGVSHLAKMLTVELVANGHGYCGMDVHGNGPDDQCLINNVIETGLKIECTDELDICTSRDAGRYLWEFIVFLNFHSYLLYYTGICASTFILSHYVLIKIKLYLFMCHNWTKIIQLRN